MTPIDAGNLLRCCCVARWYLPSIEASSSAGSSAGSTAGLSVEYCEDPSTGRGLVLSTSASRCAALAASAPPPSGGTRVAVRVDGCALFTPTELDGLKFVALNREEAPDPRAQMTVLSEAHFPSLVHMSSAVRLEAGLSAIADALPSLGAPHVPGAPHAPLSESLSAAVRAFASHTFFCFNASSDAASILPLTAAHEGRSYMLLYTCEMLLEVARATLADLGAFGGAATGAAAAGAAAAGATIPSSPLPASYLLGALSSGAAAHGVHVNEFVPGLRAEYKLIGLQTERLGAVVRAAGAGETSGEAGAASSSRADGQLV